MVGPVDQPENLETPPPGKKHVVSPNSSTSAPGTVEEAESGSGPSPIGWPDGLPSSCEFDSQFDLGKHISPAAYSRSSTQETVLSPVPKPSTKRRLHLTPLAKEHNEETPKKPKSPAVPTAAKSACQHTAPVPLVTRLQPPPPKKAASEVTVPTAEVTPPAPVKTSPPKLPSALRLRPPSKAPAVAVSQAEASGANATPAAEPAEAITKAATLSASHVGTVDTSGKASAAAVSPAEASGANATPAAEPAEAITEAATLPAEHVDTVDTSGKAPAAAVSPAEAPAANAIPKAKSAEAEHGDSAETPTPKPPAATPVAVKVAPGVTDPDPRTLAVTPISAPTRKPSQKQAPTPKALTQQQRASALRKQPPTPPVKTEQPTASTTVAVPNTPMPPATAPSPSTPAPPAMPKATQPKQTPASAAQPRVHFQLDPKAAGKEIVPETYNDRQALQGQFKRQMKDPDANKIPAEFVNAWQEAVKTNSKAAKSALFEKWLQTGKDWGLLIVDVARSHTDRSTAQKKMGWRTKAQIIALHGGDVKAAEEITSQKEAEGLVDHHPDSQHLKTYYVCTELGRKEEEESESTISMKTQAKVNCNGEAAQKLMGGLDMNEINGFLKLRTYQKEAQKETEIKNNRIPRNPTDPNKKRRVVKEMPSEPIPGMQWLVPKLLKDLTESKMWPIKLCGVKHQDTLRDTLVVQSKALEDAFYPLKKLLDNYTQDKDTDLDELPDAIAGACAARDAYAETASLAVKLCKPKGGSKKKADADDE